MSDISIVDLLAAEKLQIEKNPHILAREGYLTIKVKDPSKYGSSFPFFKPKPIQQAYYDYIDNIMAEKRPVRLWVVKPRQIGLTTASEALIYARTSQRRGINSFIVANDSKGVDYIFNMAKIHQEFMSKNFPHLTPKIKRTNKIELSFSDLHSTIYVDTARNASAGQKYTFENVILSEVALFDNAEVLFDGLMPAVPDHNNTMVIGECSAQGVGNFFHTECMKAYDGESTWDLFFPSWLNEPDYTLPVSEEQSKFLLDTITDEEKKLVEVHDATLGQLWWRRYTIIDSFRGKNLSGDTHNLYLPDSTIVGSFDKFHQFYPVTVLEAFVASGRSRFEKTVLQKWYASCPRHRQPGEDIVLGKTYCKGYFELDEKDTIVFIEQSDGPWTIFELPVPGIDYAHGADVAEGIELEEGSSKYDYSTQFFARRDTMQQVAEYRAYIEPDLFAEQCWLGLKAYNSPVAGIEGNKDGQTTIKFLRDKWGYNSIYVREVVEEERHKRRTKKLGWITSANSAHKGSRHVMINDMATFIREEHGIFYSERLIHECMNFQKSPDGKVEHAPGAHDDLVFAAGIAIQMHYLTPKSEMWKTRKRIQISYRK